MPASTSSPPAQQQPVPTAILLRNAFALQAEHEDVFVPNAAMSVEDRSGKGRRRKLKPCDELLPPPSVRLELVADKSVVTPEVQRQICGSGSGSNADNIGAADMEKLSIGGDSTDTSASSEVVLHTLLLAGSSPSLHPRWDHLDERFDLFECTRLKTTSKKKRAESMDSMTWDEMYKSMRAKVVIDVPATHDDPGLRSVLAELPLYPTDLRRLPRSAAAGQSDVNDDDDHHHAPSADSASITIPSALPPNALLVHYSDGTTRIDPALYHRLVKAGIIKETKSKAGRMRLDSGVIEDRIREDRRARRFDDDIFDMLGSGSGSGGGGGRGGGVDTIIKEEKSDKETHGKEIRSGGKNKPDDVNMSFKDDVFDLLGGGVAKDIEVAEQVVVVHDEPSSPLANSTGDSQGREPDGEDNTCPLPSQSLIESDDLRSEVEALRAMLEKEEQGLEQDRDELTEEIQALSTLVDQTRHIEKEIKLMNEDSIYQEKKRAEVEFLLEARRAKLFRDLRLIYPIQCLPDNVYTIRGLHLPTDLHGPGAPDAVISAALGYICHLVYMCSKYLCIPLRYRLFCNSSRSAVQDDGIAVYPLFRERVVEREQFDRAFTLLGRNVECLLKGRGIDFYSRSHILAKLERLFVQTNEIAGACSTL